MMKVIHSVLYTPVVVHSALYTLCCTHLLLFPNALVSGNFTELLKVCLN
jgi:hypothetical protein